MEKNNDTKVFKKSEDYSLKDFTFSFKDNKDNTKFKEIEVRFPYKDLLVSYFIFVDKEIDDKSAMNFAKEKIKALINNGKIIYYAKHYYRSVH